jgi:WD40 repeat protein
MAEEAQPFILITTPVGAFEARECAVSANTVPNARECAVSAVAVFPDRRHMVTGLGDHTLCLWDLRTGVMVKKMKGHRNWVGAVAVSRDGRLIASGDANGELIAWDGNTGESLTQPIKIHSKQIVSLDFSPAGTVLASGSWDTTTELWSTRTWQEQGNAINCIDYVHCVRHSPLGEYLAIATSKDVQIWTTDKRECIAHFQSYHAAHDPAWNYSLAWTSDGTRLLSGSNPDPTIQEWDTSTWKQVNDSWKGRTAASAITGDHTGSFVASASTDHPRLGRLSDRRTIAIFKHSDDVYSESFSTYYKHIPSAGRHRKFLDWPVQDSLFNSKACFHHRLL